MIVRKFGRTPFCNGRPERAPHIGTFCFPLCWRCTGIGIGVFVLSFCELPVFYLHSADGMMLAMLLLTPCFLDGLSQTITDYESTNKKRFISGILAGIGFNIMVASMNGLM